MTPATWAATRSVSYFGAMQPDASSRLAFGDFEFDTMSGDLERAGVTTRLAPQVAAVLRMLATRQGDVVTRAELRQSLWPDTTVEFDQGLNFCIRQLRVALGDDAGEPKYIETLHRRGYRFVTKVWAVTDGQPTVSTSPYNPSFQRPPRRQRYLPFALVIVAAALLVAALVNVRHYEPPLRLAVLYFDAPPEDTVLSGYRAQLAEALVTTTGRGYLNKIAVMGPSFTMRFAGTSTPPDTIRNAIGATHVLSGVLRREGGVTRVFAQLIRTSDRRHVYAARFADSTNRAAELASIADSIARATTMIVLRDQL